MPEVDTSVADGDPRVESFVEPYQGRPQLKGMRVRYKPAGAGSGGWLSCLLVDAVVFVVVVLT